MNLRRLLRSAFVAVIGFVVTGLWLPVESAAACGAVYATPLPVGSGCSEGAALAGVALVGSVTVLTVAARLLFASGSFSGQAGDTDLSPEQLDGYVDSLVRTAVDAAEAAGGSAATAARGTRDQVDIAEDHELAPRDHEPFDLPKGSPPNTDYNVTDRDDVKRNRIRIGQWRGRFHTDSTGRLSEATLLSGSWDPFDGEWIYGLRHPVTGKRWKLAGLVHRFRTAGSRGSVLNPDLNHLKPDVVYHVDGRFHFVTDEQARVRVAWVDDVEMLDPDRSPPRNKSWTRLVGKLGGLLYQGGHLLGREQGGPNERINLIPMLETLNRAKTGTTAETNFRRLELDLRRLATDHDVALVLTQHYPSPTSVVPDRFAVGVIVDGVPRPPISYRNV